MGPRASLRWYRKAQLAASAFGKDACFLHQETKTCNVGLLRQQCALPLCAPGTPGFGNGNPENFPRASLRREAKGSSGREGVVGGGMWQKKGGT